MLADRIQMEPSPVVNISLPITIANSKFKTSDARRGNQKSLRRRETLLKKIFEYCTECDADIHFVLRMKKTGQLYTLTSNAKEWPLSTEQIVSCSSCFHSLIQVYWTLIEQGVKSP